VDILVNEEVAIDYGIVSCYIMQLIMATDYLHQRKIVHSFINPQYIFFIFIRPVDYQNKN
jgi:hypothetical protein